MKTNEEVWDGESLEGIWDIFLRGSGDVVVRAANPTKEFIMNLLEDKAEELMMYQGNKLIIVSFDDPNKNLYDAKLIEIKEGKGRNKEKVGSFLTTKGSVSLGLTAAQRVEYFDLPLGTWIKVRCSEFTVNGKFKKAKFISLK